MSSATIPAVSSRLAHLRYYTNISHIAVHNSIASSGTVRLPQHDVSSQAAHEEAVRRESEVLRQMIHAEREKTAKVIHLTNEQLYYTIMPWLKNPLCALQNSLTLLILPPSKVRKARSVRPSTPCLCSHTYIPQFSPSSSHHHTKLTLISLNLLPRALSHRCSFTAFSPLQLPPLAH